MALYNVIREHMENISKYFIAFNPKVLVCFFFLFFFFFVFFFCLFFFFSTRNDAVAEDFSGVFDGLIISSSP